MTPSFQPFQSFQSFPPEITTDVARYLGSLPTFLRFTTTCRAFAALRTPSVVAEVFVSIKGLERLLNDEEVYHVFSSKPAIFSESTYFPYHLQKEWTRFPYCPPAPNDNDNNDNNGNNSFEAPKIVRSLIHRGAKPTFSSFVCGVLWGDVRLMDLCLHSMRETIDNFEADKWNRPGGPQKQVAKEKFVSILNELLYVAVKRGTARDWLIVRRFAKMLGPNMFRWHLDYADGKLVLDLPSLIGWELLEWKEVSPHFIRSIVRTRCHQFFWPHLMEFDANLDSKFSADYLVALLGYGHLELFAEFVNYVDGWFQQHRGLSGLTVLRNLLSTVNATGRQLVKILGNMVVEASGSSGSSGTSGTSGSSGTSGTSGSSGTSGTSGGRSRGRSGRKRHTAAFILYLQNHGMLPDFATLGLRTLLILLVTGFNYSVHNIEVFRFFLQHYVGNNGNGLIKGTKYFAEKCVEANFSETYDIHTEEIGTEHDFLHLAMTHGLVGPDDLFSVLEEGIRHRRIEYVYYTIVYGVDFPSDSDFWLGMAKTLKAEERSWEVHGILRLLKPEHHQALLKAAPFLAPLLARGRRRRIRSLMELF
ncbi:hypothetical protein HK102_003555 [Quaeritorhiza haematococci]|nr:hypothetical protein HK102_003555 [Quaeritorhiza haematococci]